MRQYFAFFDKIYSSFVLGGRFAAAAALALAAGACSSVAASQGAQQHLKVGVLEEPRSLNPLLLEGEMTALVGPTLYSHLLTVDASGNVRPDLAAEVPTQQNGGISADKRTIVYHLRSGLRWQDGTPLTASDVAFTFAAIMDPHNPVPARWGYDRVASVAATDPLTVVVRLKKAYSPILTAFFGPDQNYQVLPKHLFGGPGDLNDARFERTPVGSGPFHVVWWSRGDELELRANPYYYPASPRIAKILLDFVPSSTTLLQELRTGEIDATFQADPYYEPDYRRLPNVVVSSTPIAGFESILFNTADPVVGDVRVRTAIAQALDIERLVHDATRGTETSAGAGRGFFTWAYDPSIAGPRYDPAAAARLLDAAGWRRGPDGTRERRGVPLRLQLAYVGGNVEDDRAGELIQESLRSAGVLVELRRYSKPLFVAPGSMGGPLFGGRYQLALYGALRGVDPDDSWALGCDQMPPNGFNVMRFCDPQIDRADAQDVATYDMAARKRIMRVVQKRVAAELPLLLLWQRRSVAVYPSWLHGVAPSPLSPVWNVGSWRR